MPKKINTPPSAEPISLTEAKAHLRVDGTDDDALITSLIVTARQHVEAETERILITQTWDLYEDEFPDVIEIPYPPLQSISVITYTDEDGVTQTLATSVYTVDMDSEPGQVYEAYNQTWPNTRNEDKVVKVTFVAGYATPFTADAATDVITVTGRTFADGGMIRLSNSGGALPAGLSTLTDYYVRDASGPTFKLAATAGGAAIDITGTGTGTHFVGEVPQAIKQAMLLLIGHWYENREAVNIGSAANEFPLAVDALLAPYRNMRF